MSVPVKIDDSSDGRELLDFIAMLIMFVVMGFVCVGLIFGSCYLFYRILWDAAVMIFGG